MISGKDALGDIRMVEDKKDKVNLADVAHLIGVAVKVLLTIRGNQVAIMKHEKIELRKPETSTETTNEE